MAFDETAVLEVIEKVSRSVVNVSTVRVFRDAFYRVVPVKGMGSGFIIDQKGHILTNNHVIQGAEKIGITLADGTVLEGKVIGNCQGTDVAVIKLKANDLIAAELGDSDRLRVGQRVFAIGNPFGLTGGPTVTAGVISAVKRSIHSKRGHFENLVQTDAAINPGNSGGPLVDTQGKVVAINTAIIPFAQGIGFAIPINSAKTCAEEIVVHGMIVRPWLGVSGLTLTREIAEYYRLPVDKGVIIADVVSGGSADRAGIASGDIILEFNGILVDSVEQLHKEVDKRKVGEKARIIIFRDNKRFVAEAKLEKMP